MQCLRRFASGCDHGWDQGSEHCDHEHDHGAHQQFADTQRGIYLPADQGHVISDTCELAVIHAYLHEANVDRESHDYPCEHTDEADQRAFEDEGDRDLAGFETHGAKQSDFARPFVDRHHQQVQNTDACNHHDDDAENIHHETFAIDCGAQFGIILCPRFDFIARQNWGQSANYV